MNDLVNGECEACRIGAPLLTQDELQAALPQIPGWNVVKEKEVDQLIKAFEFPDYVAAVAFANRVAEISEEQGHHPAILLEWGRVTVRWWTHKISGLHHNDVIMAAKTDSLIVGK